MHLGKSSSKDYDHKAFNLLSAASPLQNYEFDFGVGQKQKASLGTLKSQKGAPVTPPSFNVSTTGSQQLGSSTSSHTVLVSPTISVHASFKEKTLPPGANAKVASSFSGTGPWIPPPSSYVPASPASASGVSLSGGTAIDSKPDAFASLWNSVASSSSGLNSPKLVTATATASASFSPSIGSPQAVFPASSVPTRSSGTLNPSSNATPVVADPFATLGGIVEPSLAALRRDTNTTSNSSGMNSAPIGPDPPQVPAAASPAPTSFAMNDLFGSLPSTPAAATTPVAQAPVASRTSATADPLDPFAASFSSSTSHTSGPQPASTDPFDAFVSAAPAAAATDNFFTTSSGPAASQPSPAGTSDPFASVFAAAPTGSAAPAPVDPLEALLFSSSSKPAASSPSSAFHSANHEDDDWVNVFGGGAASSAAADSASEAGTTHELADLPPPPAGVTLDSALQKGSEFYKGGHFADAIKWLTWAELLSKGGDKLCEALATRAACLKEAGEMKKAVADCSKVLEIQPDNTAVLQQRALLYEGMEKYKLGADDLRRVSQLDPSNRTVASVLNRLNKAAATM